MSKMTERIVNCDLLGSVDEIEIDASDERPKQHQQHSTGKIVMFKFDQEPDSTQINMAQPQQEIKFKKRQANCKSASFSCSKLMETVKLCLQISLVYHLSIVPTADCFQVPQQQAFMSPEIVSRQDSTTFSQPNLSHHVSNNFDWAKRLVKVSSGNLSEAPPATTSPFSSSSVTKRPSSNLEPRQGDQRQLSMVADGGLGQATFQRPATRPTFLSDFVAHKSQKLIDNLVNVEQQMPSSPALQAGINQKYFPTMGKLYNFLFPSNLASSTQFKPQQIQMKPPSDFVASSGQQNSTNAEMFSSGSQRIPSSLVEAGERKSPQQQVISLNAPYESRARASVRPAGKHRASSLYLDPTNQLQDQTMMSSSGKYDQASLDGDLSAEQVALSNQQRTELDPEGQPTFASELSDQQQLENEQHQIDIEKTSSRLPATIENHQEFTKGDGENGVQYVGDPEMQYTAERDYNFSNQSVGEPHEDQSGNSSNEFTIPDSDSNEIISVNSNNYTTANDSQIQYDHPTPSSLAEQAGQEDPSVLAQLATAANDTGHEFPMSTNSEMPPESTNHNQLMASDQEQQQNSFLAAQLPSQYDAVTGLPPDGYYDDYFKPSPSLGSTSLSSLLNQDNLAGEFSMQQNNHNIQQPDKDTYKTGSFTNSSNQSTTSSRYLPSSDLNANHQDNSFTMDYTKQYFMNQTPLRQSHALSDQNVEFLTSKRPADQNHQLNSTSDIRYEMPNVFERPSTSSTTTTQSSLSDESQGHMFRPSLNDTTHFNPRDNSTNSVDSIQLIIADTNENSRDPLNNNEKVINYINEHNSTRPIGKPARQTFVNKDMNEYPPADHHHRQHNYSGNSRHQQQPVVQRENPSNEQIRQQSPLRRPTLTSRPFESDQPEQELDEHPKIEEPTFGETSKLRPDDSEVLNQQAADEEDELKRVTTIDSGPYGSYKNDRQPVEAHASDDQPDSDSNKEAPGSWIQGNIRQKQHHSTIKPRQTSNKYSTATINERKDRNRHYNTDQRGSNSNNNYGKGHKEHRGRDNNYMRGHTMRRPQVTQANFNPKELIMNAPTPHPEAMDSAIDSISSLPDKVKRLKQNQPDKNELMNELLTALDRVKVAIYKLQPLTAKMNAIYRKSVSSNTRDIIMDHHKGTYAKRYPPGDYDNTYDRMHPSEIANRGQYQARQQNRRSANPNRTNRAYQRQANESLTPNESTANAIYLPAPREILETFKRIGDLKQSTESADVGQRMVLNDLNLSDSNSKIVATGVGRRLSNGSIEGELKIGEEENQNFMARSGLNLTTEGPSSNSTFERDSAAPDFVTSDEIDDQNDANRSPLFGYRITIFQGPEDDDLGGSTDGDDNEQFSYQIDNLSSFDANGQNPGDNETISLTTLASNVLPKDDDSMATSESSIDESLMQANATTLRPSINQTRDDNIEDRQVDTLDGVDEESSDDDGAATSDLMAGSESSKKHKYHKEMHKKKKEKKKQGKHEGEHKKGKESEEEKKKKEKKSQMRKRKEEEESKKKKEYKKIKHNKGILSKEKKTMHRDKHIKAHDRGAAKEKALKERTQIEFFEREQIVDDEFEKGKKSTIKAGWSSGKDSKKTHSELGPGGDHMNMDGSHHVKHYAVAGKGQGQEASSEKKSNKYEKKQMEAKGKKFKGWREKGYKIITETEFIDRGSLHDSAYKKRDKGAAHHQKYKKQEVSSEGHHGSMKEHHKKIHRKEEKKHKMHEKKEKHSKRQEDKEKKFEKKMEKGGEKEKKMKEKKKRRSDEKDDHESYEESLITATVEPMLLANYTGSANSYDLNKHQRSTMQQSPVSLMSAGSTTFRPTIMSMADKNQTLFKLLNDKHDNHEEPVAKLLNLIDEFSSSSISSNNSSIDLRRSDNGGSTTNNVQKQQQKNALPAEVTRFVHPEINQNGNRSASFMNNATILDIVDNLTGRQVNKTKIGTYDLDDHLASRMINNSLPLVKVSNSLAKYFPSFATAKKSYSTTPPPTTSRPRPIQPNFINNISTDQQQNDASLLMNLIKQHQQQQHQQQLIEPYKTISVVNDNHRMPIQGDHMTKQHQSQQSDSRIAETAAQLLQLVQRVSSLPYQAQTLASNQFPLQTQSYNQPAIFDQQSANGFQHSSDMQSFLDYDQSDGLINHQLQAAIAAASATPPHQHSFIDK